MALSPVRELDDDLHITEPLCAVFRRHLKSVGQKYTPERAQILDTLIRLDDLFEAEQLREALRREGRRVSKATVYRTIKLLQDAGIIQKVLIDSEQAHYQLAWGRRPRELLVRLDTKEVVQIEAPELSQVSERLCRERGLKHASHQFIVYARK